MKYFSLMLETRIKYLDDSSSSHSAPTKKSGLDRRFEIVRWEKVGATVVAKPVQHGNGVYLRVPKKVVEAYEIYTAEVVEFTVDRVKRET